MVGRLYNSGGPEDQANRRGLKFALKSEFVQ